MDYSNTDNHDTDRHDTDTSRLRVSALRKQFDSEFELSGIDFGVGANEIVALLGPSGCGKTTTLRCIAGVETPDSGQIRIGGEVVEGEGVSRPPEERDIGMVYQNYAIWPHKTVYENVVFPLKYADHDVPSAEYDQRVDEVLERVKLSDVKHEPATDLSGGQQQRTALARAIVHDPDLVLMDEALSNLDEELRKHMRYELQRLQHELGVSILYVTHDQDEAFYLADRVLVMRRGEIVERGSPRTLYERPASPFTRRFIGDHNRFEGRVETGLDGRRVVRTDLFDFHLDNVEYVGDGQPTDHVYWFLHPDEIRVGHFIGGLDEVAAARAQGATDGGDGPHGANDGRIEFSGTVVAEGIRGDEYEVTVQCEGAARPLVAHTNTYRECERGDEIDLHVMPKAIQVYPGDGG